MEKQCNATVFMAYLNSQAVSHVIPCFTFTPGIHWTLTFFYAGFQGILFPCSEPINPEAPLKSHSPLHCPYYHKPGNSLCVFPSKFSILFSGVGFSLTGENLEWISFLLC